MPSAKFRLLAQLTVELRRSRRHRPRPRGSVTTDPPWVALRDPSSLAPCGAVRTRSARPSSATSFVCSHPARLVRRASTHRYGAIPTFSCARLRRTPRRCPQPPPARHAGRVFSSAARRPPPPRGRVWRSDSGRVHTSCQQPIRPRLLVSERASPRHADSPRSPSDRPSITVPGSDLHARA